jgi:hypothetical protein
MPTVIYQNVGEINPENLEQIYEMLFELVTNKLRQSGKSRN